MANAAKIAMIAITEMSSTSVKPAAALWRAAGADGIVRPKIKLDAMEALIFAQVYSSIALLISRYSDRAAIHLADPWSVRLINSKAMLLLRQLNSN